MTEVLYLRSSVNTVHEILVWVSINNSLDHLFIFQGPLNQSPQWLATPTQSRLHGKNDYPYTVYWEIFMLKDFIL